MTKILATIGPATENIANLKKIIKYTKLVRLNGAHNNIEWHEKVSGLLKKLDKDVKILIDLPGIKPRSTNKDEIQIKKNEEIIFLYGKNKFKDIKTIKVSRPFPYSKNIKNLSVSDGKYKFKILEKRKNFIRVKSMESFVLKSGKGINLPNGVYSNEYQKKLFSKFIKKAKNVKYDAIGLSFVQNENIIKSVKKITKNKLIVSKIENTQGCKNLDKIITNSDLVMIDRGDLAAEIGDTSLFDMIEKISTMTKKRGKPLIMATENLDSMLKNSSPSKSEIVSLGYSLKLYCDVIMLSDETATSKKFQNIIKWLSKFLKDNNKVNFVANTKIFNIWSLLKDVNPQRTNLVIFTRKGYAINKIIEALPNLDIFVFTDSKKVLNASKFISKCNSYLTTKFPTKMDNFIYKNIKRFKSKIFKKTFDTLLIYVSFPRAKSRANTISKIDIKDF